MKIVNTVDLSVGYGKKVVVEGINISGYKGQVLCLLGPNGAGKTTILRTMSGLLAPISGKIYVKGKNIAEINKKSLAKLLAVVLTKKLQGELMTVFDIVATGRHPHTGYFGKLKEKDIKKIVEALKTVNAEYLAERYFDELSDGEKQKVLVARALVQEPEVIVLDEPTTHLDIRHRLELIDILKNLSKEKGITVILSLHEIDIALKSCDKVVLVKDGKIIAYGVPEDVVSEQIIKDLYGIKDASFNNLLGSVEISNKFESHVFVIGGGGFGTPIYRMLTKHHIGFSTGIIHKNDVDYEIARTIGINIEAENAFEEINNITFENAVKSIADMDIVIDSGCYISRMNEKNMDLLRCALKKGKTILSIRDEDDIKKVYGDNYYKVICCGNMENLIKEIKKAGKNIT
ncbi:MAG: ABC transporter ATP-binding protein [Clostridium sp.]|uniref:ABC transporter ATP-binding protein n=1 Tax=Clostridium sp. TaxID=1506 RepID=UPI003064F77D